MNIPEYPDAKHHNEFERGLKYQDFVMNTLAKRLGWVIQVNSSKAYQFAEGESIQGFEFKLDDRCTETNRLSIEVAEKSKKDIRIWTPSGICRKDNTIFYIQGNYTSFWIFFVKHLRDWYDRTHPEVIEKFGTIQTCYMPIQLADLLGYRIDALQQKLL